MGSNQVTTTIKQHFIFLCIGVGRFSTPWGLRRVVAKVQIFLSFFIPSKADLSQLVRNTRWKKMALKRIYLQTKINLTRCRGYFHLASIFSNMGTESLSYILISIRALWWKMTKKKKMNHLFKLKQFSSLHILMYSC